MSQDLEIPSRSVSSRRVEETPARPGRLSGRIVELDGLRGVAILLVLIFHYVFSVVPTVPHTLLHAAFFPLRLTWSGVDLFFVLSGFLIGGILLDNQKSENYFSTFYARRVHRIFPVYYISLGVFFLFLYAGPWFLDAARMRLLTDPPLANWTYPLFLQSFSAALRNTLGPHWLAPTWSLAVEEQFYLVLPLIVRLVSRRTLLKIVIGAIVGAPVLRFLAHASGFETAAYSFIACRADALGYGVLIAILLREPRGWEWVRAHRRYFYAAMLALVCGLAACARAPRFPDLGYSALALLYACVLAVAVVCPGPVLKGALRNPGLQRLGLLSYTVYLVHAAANEVLHVIVLGRQPVIDSWASVAVSAAALVLTLALAQVSWTFMESKLIARAHRKYKYVRAAASTV